MKELMILLKDHDCIEAVTDLVEEILWTSKLTSVVVALVDEEKIDEIAQLPGVISVEEPKKGTIMV